MALEQGHRPVQRQAAWAAAGWAGGLRLATGRVRIRPVAWWLHPMVWVEEEEEEEVCPLVPPP